MYQETDWSALRDAVTTQGGIVIPNFLSTHTVASIEKEIGPWRKQINFNDIYGSSILGSNRWIQHLGIASLSALKLALDERILELMESIFGEPCLLAEFSYQEKIEPDPSHLKMHTDFDGGILIFYYLSGVDSEVGSTRFIPGTHEIGGLLQTDGKPFIDEKHYVPRMKDIQQVHGGPGTAFVFDQDVWHDLPPVKKAGRRVIWCLYQPQSHPQCAIDHLYRQSFLAALNDRQRQAFGIGQPAFGRLGYLRSIGRRLWIGDVKLAAKYALKHRHIGREPTLVKTAPLRLSRVRAPRPSK
ncbi:phytanoyl-CoA dioxygenase family protein [Bradyrhizobium neotropicale]|uniref:Fe2OG dioxygenase domain-containing protein n=1 Tax=Bradyrhizobium neotropicale TaxID=1497615 RepID=A0A176ZJ31_9BRAD|nr:phytanoyl-CoA dioxygenase family protein [Bradyrhizobium neotropicale]OAF19815.1 hypothetical protein AXW67_35470 [Bradyrhizobium neotropicale]